MLATEPQSPGGDRAAWLPRLGRWSLRAVILIAQFVALLWATLAVYYSNLPWQWSRLLLAIALAAFSVWALWLSGRPKMRLAFWALLLGVIAWEVSIPPSNDRQWRPEAAVTPRAVVDGDRVRITGVRDFSYRDRNDFDVRYIDREVLLSHLTSVDFFLSYWAGDSGPVAHTWLAFNFDNAEPLAISIEARPEQGEGYDPIASMFKQFELIYVVGEERDIVGVRTAYRNEAVYAYPIRAPQAAVQRLFLIYMERINELADHAEWYSLLKSNCTLNIVRYARAAGWAAEFDPRQYLNGWADRYLYDEGLLSTALPFDRLRALARIRETVKPGEAAAAFSRRIRTALQSIRQGK